MSDVLTNLTKLKSHLGITATAEDVKLQQMLDEIEDIFFGYMHRDASDFASASVTEFLSGNGREAVLLKHRPVTAVTNAWLDSGGYAGQASGAFPSSTLMTAGVDYWVENFNEDEQNPAKLMRIGSQIVSGVPDMPSDYGVWPVGRGNIKITYTAGYSTVPRRLEMAVHQMAALIRKAAEAETGGIIKSERHGAYAYELLDGSLGTADSQTAAAVGSISSVLNGFRNIAI